MAGSGTNQWPLQEGAQGAWQVGYYSHTTTKQVTVVMEALHRSQPCLVNSLTQMARVHHIQGFIQ